MAAVPVEEGAATIADSGLRPGSTRNCHSNLANPSCSVNGAPAPANRANGAETQAVHERRVEEWLTAWHAKGRGDPPLMPTKVSSSSFDRPRWTERDARTALAALQRSGKAVSVFAAEQGLDPQRLYSWRRRLGKAYHVPGSDRSSGFTDFDHGRRGPFELVLSSGVVVRVPTSFNAAALERLLEVLRTGAC